jgi:hypothetical protein
MAGLAITLVNPGGRERLFTYSQRAGGVTVEHHMLAAQHVRNDYLVTKVHRGGEFA